LPRLVSSEVAFVFILSLLFTLPPVSSAGNLKIINVYSLSDRAAFIVMNTSNDQLMELIYENGSFTGARPLNFSWKEFSPVHWNGVYWLLQEGVVGRVGLYIYNSSLKHVITFEHGSICAGNDLRIQWNGEEYLLTFLKGSPNDNPATGECYYLTEMYLLLNDRLIPLNVSGDMSWIPVLREWIAMGEKISLINETGSKVFLNISTPRLNATRPRVYNSGIAYNGNKIWLSLTWGWDYEDVSHVKIYLLGKGTVREVYSGEVPGITSSGAMIWNGIPLFFQSVTLPGYSGLNITVLAFNGTELSRVGTFNECSQLTPVSLSGRAFILCMAIGGGRRLTIMKLFSITGGRKELLRTFTTSGYPRIYGVEEFQGFSAFEERNDSSLILYTNDSILLFNSTTVMNLLTGEKIPLPANLKERNYRVSYCCGGWILFTKSESYTLKGGKFAELKLAIPHRRETTTENLSSPGSTQTEDNTIIPPKEALALLLITTVGGALLLHALHRRR